jgi:hypothetical protein
MRTQAVDSPVVNNDCSVKTFHHILDYIYAERLPTNETIIEKGRRVESILVQECVLLTHSHHNIVCDSFQTLNIFVAL